MLVASALIGVLRGLVGFPLEQPMESVKTQWQANPKNRNEVEILKQIYREKGLYKGFYAGSLPNLTRVVLKNIYRYPLMIKLPNLIQQKIPLARNNRKIAKALTGLSIAGVEAFILCPVERFKVIMMTRSRESNISAWTTISSGKSSLIRELYLGYLPLFTRQAVAWVTFLTAD